MSEGHAKQGRVRFIHTSDWHLGRRFCEVSLVEDQAYALAQVFQALKESKADALVIAGDLYDRAVPSEDAVRLFDELLHRVAVDLRIPVVVISGNHDSAERLSFGARFFEASGVYLRTQLKACAEPVVLEARGEKTCFYGLPYADPDQARNAFDDPSLTSHDASVRAATARARAHFARSGARNAVLVGHLFAQGGQECVDSERPLMVGGSAQVSTAALDGFTYVALGHLHAPQAVGGREDICYSGSLLKYSFGEATQRKGLVLVEVEQGAARAHPLPLTFRRDVVRLEDTFEALLKDAKYDFAESAYVEATYTDQGYLIDVAARLRQRFPSLLVAMPKRLEAAVGGGLPRELPARLDADALLEGFWRHVLGDGLGPEHQAEFSQALERARKSGALSEAA